MDAEDARGRRRRDRRRIQCARRQPYRQRPRHRHDGDRGDVARQLDPEREPKRERAMKTLILFGVVLAASAMPAQAQWQRVRDASVKSSRDGSPNLSAPTPRIRGTPDLSGVWQPDGEPLPAGVDAIEVDLRFPKHMINVGADLEGGQPPMTPAAAEILKARNGVEAPAAFCKPTGIPYANAVVLPYKIVQSPKLVLVLYE